MKERLFDLLCEYYGTDPQYYGIEAMPLIEFLLSNGVIVPPKPCVKVGQTVYINGIFGGVAEPHKIMKLLPIIEENEATWVCEAWLVTDHMSRDNSTRFNIKYFGEFVFNTKKEAERAWEERKQQ